MSKFPPKSRCNAHMRMMRMNSVFITCNPNVSAICYATTFHTAPMHSHAHSCTPTTHTTEIHEQTYGCRLMQELTLYLQLQSYLNFEVHSRTKVRFPDDYWSFNTFHLFSLLNINLINVLKHPWTFKKMAAFYLKMSFMSHFNCFMSYFSLDK